MRVRNRWMLVIPVLGWMSPTLAGDTPVARDLLGKADEAYRAGEYRKCGRLYVEAMERGAGGTHAAYNGACCRALSGDADGAFDLLRLALSRGWNDVSHLENDADLESLHGDPRWGEIMAGAAANRATYVASLNEELLEIYEQDQGDRSGNIDWAVVAPRDEQRRRRVREILDAGEVKTARDHFHAAMVFQHGTAPEDYRMAHELALKAAELDPSHSTSRWLAAAAKDRYLHSVGEPQIYGTQFRKVDGRWTLEPIDESAVTDAERAEWGVPRLAEAKKRVKSMNERDRE